MTADNSTREEAAPHPDDPGKPDSPTDLTKRSALYVVRKTVREFSKDQCTDLAAALTFYAVLSIFPALVVVVSLLGVFGQGRRTTDSVLQIVGDLAPGSAADTLRAPIEQLVESPSAGFALIAGIVSALWSASGYIGAFGRAMNRIYEIDEGRPVWKLRPLQLVLTLGALVAAAAAAFMLAMSGPVATAVGDIIGAGDVALTVWNVARWPLILALMVLAVATLYYATPNVQLTALTEIPHSRSLKFPTRVAPPRRAGLPRCCWCLTPTAPVEGGPLSHAHMGGRLGSTRPTQTWLVDLSDRPPHWP